MDEEWSHIQTLRHLLFATDAWVLRTLLGEPSPWHHLDLPFDEMKPEAPGHPVRPHRAAVAGAGAAGCARSAWRTVRRVLQDSERRVTRRGGYRARRRFLAGPAPASYPVRQCLLIVLSEEWEHRLYAERDLDVLEGSSCSSSKSATPRFQ